MHDAPADQRDAKDTALTDVVPPAPRVVQSDALFGGHSQLAIVHERTVYILRKTRLGKLILTK